MSLRRSLLQLGAWSRFEPLREWSARQLLPEAPAAAIPADSVRILLGGDVNFDPTIRRMWNLGLHRVRAYNGERTLPQKMRRKLWHKIVRPMLSPDYSSGVQYLDFDELSLAEPTDGLHRVPDRFAEGTRPAEVDWTVAAHDWEFPFRKIAPFLRSQDLVVLNLETPLTDHPRDNGLFKSNPHYAVAMKQAGVTAVNLSNNHIFDAGEQGFYDTLRHLQKAGIICLGIGNDIDDARAGRVLVLEKSGVRLCFLGYTQFCNSRFASLAGSGPGLLPLDRKLMIEDIQRARQTADVVIVSVHWGLENQPNVHPAQVDLAHALVDGGADCIIGHHPHVPHAVEVYRGALIAYSLGNFIFAQRNHPSWQQNLVCELIISQQKIAGALFRPLSARGAAIFQPELLSGSQSAAAIEKLQILSLPFETPITDTPDGGYVSLETKHKVPALPSAR